MGILNYGIFPRAKCKEIKSYLHQKTIFYNIITLKKIMQLRNIFI